MQTIRLKISDKVYEQLENVNRKYETKNDL